MKLKHTDTHTEEFGGKKKNRMKMFVELGEKQIQFFEHQSNLISDGFIG